mgnify:CR=1 FL=1
MIEDRRNSMFNFSDSEGFQSDPNDVKMDILLQMLGINNEEDDEQKKKKETDKAYGDMMLHIKALYDQAHQVGFDSYEALSICNNIVSTMIRVTFGEQG